MGAMLFGQHETRGVHVRAGDMRMDVDAAGHRDKAACVDRLVGLARRRLRRDDLYRRESRDRRFRRAGWRDRRYARF